MKYVLLFMTALFLAGCCNGTGPGPAADNNTVPQSEETV